MKSGITTIIGRPNSGKSTLLNAIVGQKISIVSDKPQTTRHRILGIFGDHRGQICFADTPGIHKPQYRMNERMQRTVLDSLKDVDLVALVVDGSSPTGAGERFVLEMVKARVPKAFLLINKIDRIAKPKLLPVMRRYSEAFDFLEVIPISALKRDNITLVVDKIFEQMPEGEPAFDSELYTDRSERFLCSELIREKILERTREEIPYTTAVLLKNFDESRRATGNLIVIEAEILVERRSQQGIILGAGGLQLRELGKAARLELEGLLGCRVFLGLQVRAADKWRDNDAILDELELGR